MTDLSFSPTGLRHFRGSWILVAAVIVVALLTLGGLAAQLANQGSWDPEIGTVGMRAPVNQHPQAP